jgi:hypothetical protein
LVLPVHPAARHLRTRLAVDEWVLRWDVPRALLGIVPLGTKHVEVPLAELGSLALVRLAVRPLRLVVGILIAFGAFALGLPWWGTIGLLALGGWVSFRALVSGLELRTTTGAVHHAGVCFGHLFDAEVYAVAVDDLLRRDIDAPPRRDVP